MTLKLFNNIDPSMDRKKALKLVVLSKKGKENVSKESLEKLFKLMKRVVERNVSNYFKLVHNSPIKDFDKLEKDEVYSECFIILCNCVKNFKVSPKNCFYFYYNKSLSRTFYRLFEKQMRNDERFDKYSSYEKRMNGPNEFSKVNVNTLNLLFDSLDLTEEERRVANSKLSYIKKSDFLKEKENKDFSSAEYQKVLEEIKNKLKILDENGEL